MQGRIIHNMGIKLSDQFTYKKLLRFTLPSVAMMLISSVYSIFDGLFVSNFVGSDAFAAVNLIMPLAMLLSCFGFMAGAGGSALVSKTIGEKKEGLAREYFSLIIYLVMILSVIISVVVFIFIPQIVSLLGAEGAIYDYGITYGRILIVALPAFILQNCFQNFLVVGEKPQMGMAIAISAGVTDTILNILFVCVLEFGIAGAAASTVIGQTIGGIVPFIYFLKRKNRLLWFTKTKLHIKALGKVASNGISSFLTNISTSIIGVIYNLRLIHLIGSDGVVAYGVILYVTFIFASVFIGFSNGIAPVFSYNFGAKNNDEIRSLFKKSITFICVAAALLTALPILFAKPLASIFVSYDDSLLSLTTHAMKQYSISFLFYGFSMFGAAFFAALNDGMVSGTISFARTLIFPITAIYLLPILMGTDGIWFAVVAAEAFATAVTGIFIWHNREKYQYMKINNPRTLESTL